VPVLATRKDRVDRSHASVSLMPHRVLGAVGRLRSAVVFGPIDSVSLYF